MRIGVTFNLKTLFGFFLKELISLLIVGMIETFLCFCNVESFYQAPNSIYTCIFMLYLLSRISRDRYAFTPS